MRVVHLEGDQIKKWDMRRLRSELSDEPLTTADVSREQLERRVEEKLAWNPGFEDKRVLWKQCIHVGVMDPLQVIITPTKNGMQAKVHVSATKQYYVKKHGDRAGLVPVWNYDREEKSDEEPAAKMPKTSE